MPEINLLPWREIAREERKREFFVVLGGSAVFMIALVFLVHIILGGMIRGQNSINDQIKQKIAILDIKIKEIEKIEEAKANLIARMEVIQRLQATRPLAVHLFDEVVRILPPGIFITQAQKEGNKITLVGKAESNTRVSELMRNIERSPWLTNPVLTEIKNDQGESRVRDFELQMQQKLPRSLLGRDTDDDDGH